MVEANKTYVGFVEDNNDPDKIGRIKVRVMDVFDDMEIEDIPWATPWKDLNGNSFNVPEVGKVVMVVFDQGNVDAPEFIYADHYNINLENKLKKLGDSDYLSMKSLIFDHKTQVYVNDSEGLKIDHKFNNINIINSGIDLNLKDNSSNVNIGDSGANQQVILGNHWMDWFDELVDNLLGANGGAYFGNLGAPTVISPALATHLIKYKSLRNTKFLSSHVNVVDNNKVKTVPNTEREDLSQYGDEWSSTVHENELTDLNEDENFVPKEEDELDPNIEVSLNFLEKKGYKVNYEVGILNILAIRDKESGQVTNKFDDEIKIIWKSEDNDWNILEAPISTVPGFIEGTTQLDKNEILLSTGQYTNNLELDEDNDVLYFNNSKVFTNKSVTVYKWTNDKEDYKGNKIKPADREGNKDDVFGLSSNGDQTFKNINHFKFFINLCKRQVKKYKFKTFTYTLVNKSDFDNFLNSEN